MRSLFVILLILSVLAILFSVREVRTVYERVQNQVEVERSRRLSEEQSLNYGVITEGKNAG